MIALWAKSELALGNINQAEQYFLNASKINKKVEDLIFLYNAENVNDSEKELDKYNITDNQISIVVYDQPKFNDDEDMPIIKNSKQIICPKCTENCLIVLDNYKITLNNCDNGHSTENILIKDFNNSQKIDSTKIKCSGCEESLLSKKQLYFCIECKVNFCLLCNSKHKNTQAVHLLRVHSLFYAEEPNRSVHGFASKKMTVFSKNISFIFRWKDATFFLAGKEVWGLSLFPAIYRRGKNEKETVASDSCRTGGGILHAVYRLAVADLGGGIHHGIGTGFRTGNLYRCGSQ